MRHSSRDTHIYSRTNAHKCARTHTYTFKNTLSHAHTRMLKSKNTPMPTLTPTPTLTPKHTCQATQHTLTHIHKHILPLFFLFLSLSLPFFVSPSYFLSLPLSLSHTHVCTYVCTNIQTHTHPHTHTTTYTHRTVRVRRAGLCSKDCQFFGPKIFAPIEFLFHIRSTRLVAS